MAVRPNFQEMVDAYVREDVPVRPRDPDSPEVPWGLKVATVAQWLHESARGASDLAEDHLNFGGLKWLDPEDTRTDPFATRVWAVTPSEPNGEHWRSFGDIYLWLSGYWQFIETGAYGDPMDYAGDPAGYIGMLRTHGYATNERYVKRVTDLFDEAEALLLESAQRQGIDPDTNPRPDGETFRLAVVVGHNSVAQGADSPWLDPEWTWNSEIARLMERRAGELGIELRVFFRTSGGSPTAEIQRVYRNEVNPWNPDLCMELHYNAGGGDGTEMLYWLGSEVGEALARNLADGVSEATGLPTNRRDHGIWGIRSGNGAVSLREARAPNCVVEPFFGDTKANVDLVLAAGGQSTLADAYLDAALMTAEAHGLISDRPVPPPAMPPPGTETLGEIPAKIAELFETTGADQIRGKEGDYTLIWNRPTD